MENESNDTKKLSSHEFVVATYIYLQSTITINILPFNYHSRAYYIFDIETGGASQTHVHFTTIQNADSLRCGILS